MSLRTVLERRVRSPSIVICHYMSNVSWSCGCSKIENNRVRGYFARYTAKVEESPLAPKRLDLKKLVVIPRENRRKIESEAPRFVNTTRTAESWTMWIVKEFIDPLRCARVYVYVCVSVLQTRQEQLLHSADATIGNALLITINVITHFRPTELIIR